MKKRVIIPLVIGAAAVIGLAGTYLGIGLRYADRFFENTSINGIDVSGMTVSQAEAAIAGMVEDYEITLKERGGSRETIGAEQMGYRFVSGGEVQEFLDSQNILEWLPNRLRGGTAYTMTAATAFEEERLRQSMLELNCFDPEQVTAPADAEIVRQEDGSYQVTPEIMGNTLQEEKVFELLKDAARTGEREVDLEAEGCYQNPSIYGDDEELNEKAAALNRYASMTVTYQMGGDVTEVLDSATITGWLSADENDNPVFDREAIRAYVAGLAEKYDTIGTWEPFTTSLGQTVYVEARTYGWQLNQEQEAEELYQVLMAGESTERWPVYYEGAASRGVNDIGDTYVEIDYTTQRMWYYKDGSLVVDTPVVTGCVANGTESPEGIFCVVDKSEDEILKGEGYSTPVDYWMPFYEGVGIHDADSWRGNSYGGSIYLYGGSHGCINTPTANAAIMYQEMEIGTPVICYKSDGTGTHSSLG